MTMSRPATMVEAKAEVRGIKKRGDDAKVGGRSGAPSPHPLARLRQGAWFAVLVKGFSIGLAMLGLAAIGTISIQRGPGVPLETASLRPSLALATAQAMLTSAPSGAGGSASPPSPPPGSNPAPATNDGGATGAPRSQGITSDGKVILNTADASELTRLPSVGAKRAQQIIELRTRLKRFRSPNDLLRVRGIGPRTLEKMRPYLVLDPRAAEAPKDSPTVKP
jgi:competence protein ComEA